MPDRLHDLGMKIGIHGIGHDREPYKDEPESGEDIAHNFYALILGEHGHEHAHNGQNEKERRNVEAAERGDPCRDGGPDIGAHDDGGRLEERHDPRVDKTDDHDGGRRRALNDDGRRRADPDARDPVVRRLVEHRAELSVRQTGHAVRHHFHADEERAQPSQQLQHEIQYVHNSSLLRKIPANRQAYYNKKGSALSRVFHYIEKFNVWKDEGGYFRPLFPCRFPSDAR